MDLIHGKKKKGIGISCTKIEFALRSIFLNNGKTCQLRYVKIHRKIVESYLLQIHTCTQALSTKTF